MDILPLHLIALHMTHDTYAISDIYYDPSMHTQTKYNNDVIIIS